MVKEKAVEEVTALPDKVQLIINCSVEDELQDDNKLAGIRLVVENDNDLLPGNLKPCTNAQNEKTFHTTNS